MLARFVTLVSAGIVLGVVAVPPPAPSFADSARPVAAANGLVKQRSAYGLDETLARLKADIAAKGISFFLAVDQSRLAADAGIKIGRSTLLIFGNPALGTQFMTRNPDAGIDWPVRVLVFEDAQGAVWVAYTDFGWIARRHGIGDDMPFQTASGVIASIASSVAK